MTGRALGVGLLLGAFLAGSVPGGFDAAQAATSGPGTALAGALGGVDRDGTPGAERFSRDRGENARRVGLSLLLPGAAHLHMGERRRAAAFIVAEAATWTAWGVFRVQGAQRRDSYIEMAKLDAGVPDAEGRGDAYYHLLGSWSSSDAYDQLVRREARDLYPDDLQARAAYFEANRTAADRSWRWESLAAWDRYRAKRNDSRQAYRSARMMLGLAAANRVVAMVDAALLARRQGGDGSWRMQAEPGAEPGSFSVSLSLPLP